MSLPELPYTIPLNRAIGIKMEQSMTTAIGPLLNPQNRDPVKTSLLVLGSDLP